jgi:hypothetical protein
MTSPRTPFSLLPTWWHGPQYSVVASTVLGLAHSAKPRTLTPSTGTSRACGCSSKSENGADSRPPLSRPFRRSTLSQKPPLYPFSKTDLVLFLRTHSRNNYPYPFTKPLPDFPEPLPPPLHFPGVSPMKRPARAMCHRMVCEAVRFCRWREILPPARISCPTVPSGQVDTRRSFHRVQKSPSPCAKSRYFTRINLRKPVREKKAVISHGMKIGSRSVCR